MAAQAGGIGGDLSLADDLDALESATESTPMRGMARRRGHGLGPGLRKKGSIMDEIKPGAWRVLCLYALVPCTASWCYCVRGLYRARVTPRYFALCWVVLLHCTMCSDEKQAIGRRRRRARQICARHRAFLAVQSYGELVNARAVHNRKYMSTTSPFLSLFVLLGPLFSSTHLTFVCRCGNMTYRRG